MPDPTPSDSRVPDAIAPIDAIVPIRPAAPPQILSGPDPRAIDLSELDRLDDGERERLARAGQDALDACLRRLSPAERAAFWHAVCRCYNRPYNPVDGSGGEIPSAGTVPVEIVLADAAPGLPDPHVIEAARPDRDGARR
ncbi:hypothetical protein [Methylobacterium indicum]|uniref:hypothetical protein n=1 Tax=Methylobacterium indicum TaxID=1775910 RepID=UPI00243497F0|nr:hypothetical protein [Methylobacterium indicum]